MTFRFAHPVLLVILIAVLAAYLAYRFFMRKPPAVDYPLTSRLARISGSSGSIMAGIPDGLRILSLILLVIAVARPQMYNVSREVLSPGVDIMLCLDTSGSMRGLDFELNGKPATRLTAVKKVVNDFIMKRPNDRMGIVVFGQQAFTQAPLTMDKGLLLSLVDNMQIGMAGDSTAIGSALAISGKRLKDLQAPSKVVVLLTDGNSNAGEITPQEAANALKALGIKVYTIGVGGTGETPFLMDTPFGKQLVYQRVDLNEDALREIAAATGGRYFLASNTDDLSKIYGIIDSLEKHEVRIKEFFHYNELYLFFLIPALAALAAEFLLKATIVRVLP
ncbi:MAG TPA: VWA domain-containing protein [Deltaproteobacteria bacterium]|jgi:Ca-activated chloride channel family protein|nr:VWA domain-containing protein [Deltaproteobacteria bacterium]HQI01660.1 VWA domain-containing protein [Deltaproteobacteria bacterium]HQJ09107.1 VWA domain-containing protein [Deltaproteobacteria bacterium]